MKVMRRMGTNTHMEGTLPAVAHGSGPLVHNRHPCAARMSVQATSTPRLPANVWLLKRSGVRIIVVYWRMMSDAFSALYARARIS
jgi:hypothetical protein